MNSEFDPSASGLVRVLSVLAAVVVTATLFTAVTIGLTGDDGWALLSQAPAATHLA